MRLRALTTAVMTGALAAAVLAAPAAAGSNATVRVAHGIPGATVDVCVAGNAVKRDFKFGSTFKASLPAGSYTIRVRLAAHEDCKGAVVIKQTVALSGGLNATAVAVVKNNTPQLAIYVNDVETPPTHARGTASLTVIHEATAPKVDVWLNSPVRLSTAGVPSPTLSGVERGDQLGPVGLGPDVYTYFASLQGKSAPVIGPSVTEFKNGRAYTVIAVGTNAHNYRFIVFGQPFAN